MLLCAAAGGAAVLIAAHKAPVVPLASGTLLVPSRALADFSLLDQQGRRFGRANLRGHWSLMFFGYTHCADICPATLATLAAVEKRMRTEASPLPPQVIFVSLDARRDTPAQLAKYLLYFDAEFIGLTAADQPAIEALAKQWGVALSNRPVTDGNDTVDHSAAIFVIDPKGDIAAILTGPFTSDALQSDIARIVTGHA